MPGWEYKLVTIGPGEKVGERLNECGADGWEVAYMGQAVEQTFTGPQLTWQVVFKRPKAASLKV